MKFFIISIIDFFSLKNMSVYEHINDWFKRAIFVDKFRKLSQ